MKRIGKFIKDHPAIAAVIGAAAVGGAAYYGVSPEQTQAFLRGACIALGC